MRHSNKDVTNINNIAEDFKLTHNLNILTEKEISYITTTIKNILNKHLPNIPNSAIDKYLDSGTVNKIDNYKSLITNIQNLLTGTGDDIVENIRIENRKFAIKNREYEEISRFNHNVEKPVYQQPSYKGTAVALSELADKFIPYITVKTELNSANAEGNLSSDLLDNNYILNIFKQIAYGELDKNTGLRALLDFVKSSPQYTYSPLFFGTYADNGAKLSDGLFIKNINGISINPKAKNILDVFLFAGISNRINNNSSLYSKMNKGDYFMARLTAFFNPINEYGNQIEVKDTANYFLETPSDAGKNFMIRAPRLETAISLNRRDVKVYNDKIISNVEVGSLDGNISRRRSKYAHINGITNLLFNTPETYQYDLNNSIVDNDQVSYVVKTELPEGIIVKVEVIGSKIKESSINTMKVSSVKMYTNYTPNGIPTMPIAISNLAHKDIIKKGVISKEIKLDVDRNTAMFKAAYNILYGEIHNFVEQLNYITERRDGKQECYVKSDLTNLFGRYHYNGDSLIKTEVVDGVEQYRFSGNAFSFIKLFSKNNSNVDAELTNILLYGDTPMIKKNSKGEYIINNKHRYITTNNGKVALRTKTEEIKNLQSVLEDIVDNWLTNNADYIVDKVQEYDKLIEDKYNYVEIIDSLLNQDLSYYMTKIKVYLYIT